MDDNWNIKYGGLYIDNRLPAYNATLALKEGPSNVRIMFAYEDMGDYAKCVGNLERSHKDVIDRVSNIPFIKEKVLDAGQTLRIWYFNNRNVNDYLVMLAVDRLRENKMYGVDWADLNRAVVVEFFNKGMNMYLALPDGRLVMFIENNWRYNYAGAIINPDGTRTVPNREK